MFRDKGSKLKDSLLAFFAGYASALLFSLSAILIASALLCALPSPLAYIEPLGAAVLYLSAFLGGCVSYLRARNVLSPSLCALSLLATVLLGLFVFKKPLFSLGSLTLLLLSVPLACALGSSFVWLLKKRTPKRRKSKKRR